MKEIKKIKELTEKLKREGDVSQEEADLIYMFERLQEAHRSLVGVDMIGLFPKFGFPKLKSDSFSFDNVEFDFISGFLNPMSSALKEWYETVADLVALGRTGNFVTTIPTNTLLSKRKEEKDTVYFMKRAIEHLSKEDRAVDVTGELAEKVLSSADSFLVSDFIDHGSFLRFSRYGLMSRLERKNGDVLFLKKMMKKLKKEDITLEESDAIYTIIKFTQAMNGFTDLLYSRIIFEGIKGYSESKLQKQIKRRQKALSSWFEEVYKAASTGRSGNFLYTLPVYGLDGLDGSHKYIRKSLELLPEQLILAKLSDKPVLPDMAGIFFDDERNVLMSQRYNIVREVVKPDKYVRFLDPNGISCAVERKKNAFSYVHARDEERTIINPFVVKVEFLSRRKGISPVCRFCNTDLTYFIAYDRKDKEIVERILDMPEEGLKSELPTLSRERNLSEVLEESFCVMDMFDMAELEEDDSWLEIIR